MEKDLIINLFRGVWPMVLIFCVVIISLRIIYIIKYKIKFVLYEELFYLAFLVYIMLLFHIVTFQDVSWSSSNFTFFKEIFRYRVGSRVFYRNVIGNMMMFMPYGLFVSYFFKLKRPYLIIFLSLIVSITIETTQMVIGRVFDVDDILLNVLGGLIGYLLYKILKKIISKLPSFLKKTYLYNIIVILVIVMLFIIIVVL